MVDDPRLASVPNSYCFKIFKERLCKWKRNFFQLNIKTITAAAIKCKGEFNVSPYIQHPLKSCFAK